MDHDRPGCGPEQTSRAGACVLIVDDASRLSAASPAAEALLAAGTALRLRDGVVTTAGDDDARAFAAMVRRLASTVGTGHLRVRAVTGRVGLTMTTLAGARDGVRIAIVAEDVRAPADRAAAAAARFGLTGAEARVLALLCDGCAPSRMAERLAVAPTTVRTHLQRIFDKTDARRQSDVVRLVLTTVDRPLLSS